MENDAGVRGTFDRIEPQQKEYQKQNDNREKSRQNKCHYGRCVMPRFYPAASANKNPARFLRRGSSLYSSVLAITLSYSSSMLHGWLATFAAIAGVLPSVACIQQKL